MDLGFQFLKCHTQTQIQQQINKYQHRSFLYVWSYTLQQYIYITKSSNYKTEC